MVQIHRKKPIITQRQTSWHPKHPIKESFVQKVRKAITPERVSKAKSTAGNIADKFNRFMEWGASRTGAVEMRGFDMDNPMGTQRRRTTKRKTTKKSKRK